MRIHEAIAVFRKYGVDVADMPLDQVRKVRNALIQKYHPDIGGAVGIAQEINAAFDLLRNIAPDVFGPTPQPKQPTEPQPEADINTETEAEAEPKAERVVRTDHDLYRNYGPSEQSAFDWASDDSKKRTYQRRDYNRYTAPDDKWAWAGHFGSKVPDSSIHKNDFTDLNFIKRSMWELSRHSNDEWTISGYDGKTLSHNIIVYGSPGIFHYMAIAMIDFQTKRKPPAECRAVFARLGISHDLYLIYADGKYYDQNPVRIRHEAVGSNPKNYSRLIQKIPEILSQLKNKNSE
jgi:hypothetical protein